MMRRGNHILKFYLAVTLFLLLFALSGRLASQEQKIKPGDGIEIIVYGHEELSRVVTVNPQGTIDFPFVQNIPVDGLTIARLQELLVAQLSRYLGSAPIVTINIVQNQAMKVGVMGYVVNPGIIQVPNQSRLQDAIAKADGFLPGANRMAVTLMREVEGQQDAATYNLDKFVMRGDLDQNPILQENDKILVTRYAVFTEVKVIGQVHNPGSYEFLTGANVLDMIFRAGGLTEKADPCKIHFISPTYKSSSKVRIDLEEYYKARLNADLPLVKPGDIIYVPEKKTSFWHMFINISKDLLIFAQFGYYYYLIRWVK